jgi:hypothetical protein
VPIDVRYDDAFATIFINLRGRVTDDELLDYARKATQTPPPGIPHNELLDTRGIEYPEASTAALREVAHMFTRTERGTPGVKIAIVAISDAEYGIARMYQAFRDASTAEIRVYREMADAREWLGLPPDEDGA